MRSALSRIPEAIQAAFLAALLLSMFFGYRLWANVRKAEIARKFADASVAWQKNRPTAAVLAALESINWHRTQKAEESLLQALNGLGHPGKPLAIDGHISAIAFSPNGRWLAAGSSYDVHIVDIWDVQTRKEVFSVSADHPVNTLAWSRNGKLLAVAAGSLAPGIWDVDEASAKGLRLAPYWVRSFGATSRKADQSTNSGEGLLERLAEQDFAPDKIEALREMEEETDHGNVVTLAWDSSGRFLAGLNRNGREALQNVGIWEARTGRLLRKIPAPKARSMSWIPGSDTFAIGTSDGDLETWDIHGRRLGSTKAGNGAVTAIGFGAHTQRAVLALAIDGRNVNVWAAYDAKPPYITIGGTPLPFECQGDGRSLSLSPSGRLLACADGDSILVWETENNAGKAVLLEAFDTAPDSWPHDAVSAIAWSPDEAGIAFPANQALRLTGISTPFVRTLLGRAGAIQGLCWSADGNQVIADDDELHVWDVEHGALVRTIAEAGSSHTKVLYAGGARAAAVSNSELSTWEVASGRLLRSVRVRPDELLVGGSPDGRQFAWRAAGGTKIRDADDDRLLVSLGDARPVVWSPDGKRLASFTHEGLQIHGADGRLQRNVGDDDPRAGVTAAAWSPDGRRISAAQDDGSVTVWDTVVGRVLKTWLGDSRPLVSLAWSRDGRLLASGSEDGRVRVWDPSTGEVVHTIDAGRGSVTALAWSRDGRLATGSADGVVKIWVLDPKAVESAACGYVSRNLTSPEWEHLGLPCEADSGLSYLPYHRTCPELP